MLGGIIGGIGNIIGGILGNNQAEKIAQQNIALQREFAQMGIRWKVADAKAAGVHPLYALGASTHSFSPVSVGYQNPLSGLPEMGQSIDRAVAAGQNADERIMGKLRIENQALQNDILKQELLSKNARMQAGQIGPAFPGQTTADGLPFLLPGQGNSTPSVKAQPLEVTVSAGPGNREPAAIADVGWARTNTGWTPVPSLDVKQRIEDMIIPELLWSVRNNVMPSFGSNLSPPPFRAPPGQRWFFHIPTQEYRLVPNTATKNELGYGQWID